MSNCSELISLKVPESVKKIEEWKNIEFENEKANPMSYATSYYWLDENSNVEFNGKHCSFTMLN